MSEESSEFERALLRALAAENGQSPATLAMALDRDLGDVLDAVAALTERGLLERQGFDTCRLTDAGRASLEG